MCGTNTCMKQLEHALTFWVGALRDQSYHMGTRCIISFYHRKWLMRHFSPFGNIYISRYNTEFQCSL